MNLLEQFGIESDRVRLEWISASEGEKFAKVVKEFTDQLKPLGPLNWQKSTEAICETDIGAKMAKPKVAFYWCASCGGCEETIVDLAEDILKVVEAVDIVLWPVAMDYKLKDVEAWEPGEVAVAFINGAIRLSEQEKWVKLLRQKCSLVVAFGSCAHMGGIPGLANCTSRSEILANKYHRSPTIDNPDGIVPQEQTGSTVMNSTAPLLEGLSRPSIR